MSIIQQAKFTGEDKIEVRLLVSLLTQDFNWFHVEQYLYAHQAIHVPLSLSDLFSVEEKLKRIGCDLRICVDSSYVEKWLNKRHIPTIHIDSVRLKLDEAPQLSVDNLRDDDGLASILFTSGSSGVSKAVIFSHKNQQASYLEFAQTIMFEGCKTYLPLLNHSFSGGRKVFYAALLAGLELMPYDGTQSIIENLKKSKPDLIACVPSMLQDLLSYFKAFGNDIRLKNIICGGASIAVGWHEAFLAYGITLYNVYGLTEMTSLVAYPHSNNYPVGSVGSISTNVEYQLTNQGELQVKGDMLALAYVEDGELKKIGDDAGFLHTKDVVRISDEGNLFILGRLSNRIKSNRGEYIDVMDFIGLEALQLNSSDVFCFYSPAGYELAIKHTVSALALNQIKANLLLLKPIGIEFKRIILYKFTHNSQNKPSRHEIYSNIIKEIYLDEYR